MSFCYKSSYCIRILCTRLQFLHPSLYLSIFNSSLSVVVISVLYTSRSRICLALCRSSISRGSDLLCGSDLPNPSFYLSIDLDLQFLSVCGCNFCLIYLSISNLSGSVPILSFPISRGSDLLCGSDLPNNLKIASHQELRRLPIPKAIGLRSKEFKGETQALPRFISLTLESDLCFTVATSMFSISGVRNLWRITKPTFSFLNYLWVWFESLPKDFLGIDVGLYCNPKTQLSS
ncbi:hypothetical protein LXL04_022590 [Taraxacum kok-saghyz]